MGNGVQVVTSLDAVATALGHSVGGGLGGGAAAARGREGGHLDGLSVLENGTSVETGVDGQEVIERDTKGRGNTGREVSGLDNVDTARVAGLVGVAAALGPGGELEVLVGLQDAVGDDVSVEVLQLLVVDAQGVGNRVDGVALLDNVDLAVLVGVVGLDVGASRLVGSGKADFLADLEETGGLTAGTQGSIEIIWKGWRG